MISCDSTYRLQMQTHNEVISSRPPRRHFGVKFSCHFGATVIFFHKSAIYIETGKYHGDKN